MLISFQITQHAEALHEKQSKICRNHGSIWLRGREPVIQQRVDKERYFLDWKLSLVLYFGFVALGFSLWDERNVRTMRDLEDVVIYPLYFANEKTTPRKGK